MDTFNGRNKHFPDMFWRFIYSLHSKLCENTKNYKSAYPGSNKVVYGVCEEFEENNLIFECAKLDFCKK